MEILINIRNRVRLITLIVLVFTGCSKEKPIQDLPSSTITSSILNEGYIGDKECAFCHEDIYTDFKQNGMGRSFYLPTAQNIIEDYQSQTSVYDEKNQFHYEVMQNDSLFFQKEYRVNDDNNSAHELIYKVDYIIGSGNHTRSYLRKENGFIYELPITWYSQEKKWDLSPSYRIWNQRFERPITQECMNCHNSYAQYRDYSANQYIGPIPLGIGCERCHGPGLDHVNKRLYQESEFMLKGTRDSTIVNPKYLSASKQVDVCFQCHLQGEMTVFKNGKKQTDFKPGMAISEIKSIYIDSNQVPGNPSIASQGTRMLMSPCYKKSAGQLLCTTCHNPHTSIDKTPIASYTKACLSCHQTELLSDSNQEIDHRPIANCISCHMLKSETSDIPHVTGTDHWIRKRPIQKTKGEIVNSHIAKKLKTLTSAFEEGDATSDIRLGIAYIKYFEAKHSDADYLERAITMLRSGLIKHPNHSNGLFYLGKAYSHRKEYLKAEHQFNKLIKIVPSHALAYFELAHTQSKRGKLKASKRSLLKSIELFKDNSVAYNNLGNLYSELNRLDDAVSAYEKAIDIQPSDPNAYHNLGDLLLGQRQAVNPALTYIEKALKRNPDFIQARLNLGVAKMMSGNDAEAIATFNRCLEINPNFVPAHGNLAKIFIRTNNNRQAMFHVQKILEFQPGNKDALSLLKVIKG